MLLSMLELILMLTVTEKYYVEHYNAWNDEWIRDAWKHDEWHGLGHDDYLAAVCHANFCHTYINRDGAAQVSA